MHKRLFLGLMLLGICSSSWSQQHKEDVSISMDTTFMQQVTINGQRQRISYRLDRQRVNADAVLSAQGGTALDVLAALPSVQIDSQGELSFRGSQNFLVYVDGKPSPLSGSQALQMIPSATIRDIEILTTPSARYRTDGDVGIINIITKRATTDGWDVNVNASASTHGTTSLDGKINYRMGAHNFYAGGQGSRLKTKSDFEQKKWTMMDDYVTTSDADGTRFRGAGTYIGQGGYEFQNRQHRFQWDVQGGRTRNPRGGDMDYYELRQFQGATLDEGQYDSHDRYKLTKYLFQTSTDYTWKVNERGDEFNINNRFRYDRFSEEYTESNMFDQSGNRFEGTRGYETEHHWDCDGAASYKLKYRQKGQLEVGYQYTTYSEHGDYKICYWNLPAQTFDWQGDLYAPFYYRRQTHSAYAQINDQYGPVAFDAGLRADRLLDDMDLPTITSRHKRYTELYPSAHVSYTASQAGTFALGYSRRANRPGIWKLEPYITYEDYYTRIIGNPDLATEYVHSMELTWRKTLESGLGLAATGYARHRSGVVDYIRRAYQPGVTLDSIINAGDEWRQGLEFQLTAKPYRWWNIAANAAGFHYDFDADYEGCHDSEGWSYQLGWINNFTLAKNTAMQFDGHLVGPQHITQGRESGYVYFDLAIRQQLLGGKIGLGLVAHDVFHTARYHNKRYTSTLVSETWVRPRYPNIMFSVTYHFRQPASQKAKQGALSSDAEFVGKEF